MRWKQPVTATSQDLGLAPSVHPNKYVSSYALHLPFGSPSLLHVRNETNVSFELMERAFVRSRADECRRSLCQATTHPSIVQHTQSHSDAFALSFYLLLCMTTTSQRNNPSKRWHRNEKKNYFIKKSSTRSQCKENIKFKMNNAMRSVALLLQQSKSFCKHTCITTAQWQRVLRHTGMHANNQMKISISYNK